MELTPIIKTTTPTTTTDTALSVNESKQRMSELSFHTLRKSLTELMSYEYNSTNNNKNNIVDSNNSNNSNNVDNKKKNSITKKKSLSSTQNISELAYLFSKKYPSCNIPNSKTVPSFWSSNSSIDEDNDDKEDNNGEETDEETDEKNKIISSLSHSHSTLSIQTVIPRTNSFMHEMAQEQQQNKKKMMKKKNEIPITQIIPADRKLTVVSTIETLFGEAPTLSFDNMLPTMAVKKHGLNHLRKSAPTSISASTNTFSSILLPPTLKRSATRTSFKSTTTTTSSNSSSSSTSSTTTLTNPSTLSSSSCKQQQDKKYMSYAQLSYWFAPPPPRPSSITAINDSSKRSHVIQELLLTEKSYQTDMELIKEIYYELAFEVFSKTEVKQIFINLLDIIAFEKEFFIALETACHCDLSETNSPRERTTISGVFNQMMSRMVQIYGDYCKKHEDAVCKIQELSAKADVQDYFEKCRLNIQGRTMCWDLPSLLIKPVQRILKYPLLLRELLSLTPENHPDYEQLANTTNEIQKVADHINEIKRRKDLVEQLISEKKKADRNVVQGINKRFTRRVHRKKQLSATQDILFDDLYKQFEGKQEMARQFESSVQNWLSETKNSVHALSDLIQSLESVYGDSDGIGLRSMHAFKSLATQLKSNFMDSFVQKSVYDRIDAYLKLFRNPSHIIQKRNHKLLDYDRAKYMISKGEIPDKALQQSVEAYVSLNAQLLEELPIFLSLTDTYFEIILNEFSRIQALYWYKTKIEWKMLTIELPFGQEHTWDSIVNDYKMTMKRLQPRMDEIQSKPDH